MNRVLHTPELAGAVCLGEPPAALDTVARTAVDRASSTSYRRGLADGREAALAEAVTSGEQAASALAAALDDIREELARLRAVAVTADVELAMAMAAVVLGREAGPDVETLCQRVLDAAARLDDQALVVRAHPDERAAMARVCEAADERLEVVADERCQPGEARVVGDFGRAALTRDDALAALGAAVAEAADG